MLPRSVTIVVGDVGDLSTLKAAVEGCNKIIYCATARSAITGDLNRVDNQGVRNVTKAFLVFFLISLSTPLLSINWMPRLVNFHSYSVIILWRVC